jgi:tetratricopeptide (TPR) repeat protein
MKPAKKNAPASASSPDATRRAPLPVRVAFLLLLVANLAAYWPCLTGALLWDDVGHITSPALQSWSGLLRIWFEPGATQQYYPLLHTAFWIEHRLWGDATLGYHLINVVWHATSACLFFVLLRRLALPGAFFAATLFALHPICVESVAWISEQKNTLSLVFYLAAALAWLRFEGERNARCYVIATLWFCAALLTKTVTATLPCALLVLAWWRRGRLSWRDDVRPLFPWFVLGVTAGFGTAWFESTQIGAQGADFAFGPIERVLLAGRVVWFYLGTLVWPLDLAFFYPRWTIDAGAEWQWLFPLASAAGLATAAWWTRRDRAPLAVALLFGGTLFPVLGFVNVYPFVFSYVADHFQYHASLAMFAFLTAVAVRGWQRLPLPRWSGRAAAAGVLVIAATLTWRQSAHYRDVITLYRATLERSPESWVAHLNLGVALSDVGENQEALPHLQRALALKPDHPETLNSLGNVLNQLGRPAEARPLLERAVQLSPRFATAHNTLGTVLMALNQPDAGLASLRRAVELDARFVTARVNLGWALANTGRPAEALAQLEQARRLEPADANVELKTALVYAMSRRFSDALPHARRAVELRPDDPDMRSVLGSLLLELGRVAEAADQFEEALALAPNHRVALAGLERARSALPRR